MIVTAAHTLRFYRRAEIRSGQLASAHLQALQAQLQPHFLFNTLNTIAGLVHKSPDKADSVLTMLSDLLRFSLETNGETQVPIQHEVEFTEKYLAIMRVRYGERCVMNSKLRRTRSAPVCRLFSCNRWSRMRSNTPSNRVASMVRSTSMLGAMEIFSGLGSLTRAPELRRLRRSKKASACRAH